MNVKRHWSGYCEIRIKHDLVNFLLNKKFWLFFISTINENFRHFIVFKVDKMS